MDHVVLLRNVAESHQNNMVSYVYTCACVPTSGFKTNPYTKQVNLVKAF